MGRKRKTNHGKVKTPAGAFDRKDKSVEQRVVEAAVLKPGETRHSIVAHAGGDYVRVSMEYVTHAADGEHVGQQILEAMYGGARTADLRALAAQRPQDIIEGEILTPDGRFVVQRWIPIEGELLMLQARPATMEDIAELDRYGEPIEETEPRKAEARQRIRARDESNGRTGVLRDHGSILEAAQA